MNITGELLARLWDRSRARDDAADIARKVLPSKRPYDWPRDGWPNYDMREAALRTVKWAEAFAATVERLSNAAAEDVLNRCERLDRMRRWPDQFTSAELLVERETLGVSERFCLTRCRMGRAA